MTGRPPLSDDELRRLLALLEGNHRYVTAEGLDVAHQFGFETGKLKVIAPSDAGADAVLVCGRYDGVRYIADNRIGRCSWCRAPIQWRPEADSIATKICSRCLLAREGSRD